MPKDGGLANHQAVRMNGNGKTIQVHIEGMELTCHQDLYLSQGVCLVFNPSIDISTNESYGWPSMEGVNHQFVGEFILIFQGKKRSMRAIGPSLFGEFDRVGPR